MTSILIEKLASMLAALVIELIIKKIGKMHINCCQQRKFDNNENLTK